MGHSFCSGPSLPDGLKTEQAVPGAKIKLTPRSPGFTAERRQPTDDLTNSQNLHAIKDLIQRDPLSLVHNDSKHRKKFIELLRKPGHLSSKQFKHMLLLRRSVSARSSAQASVLPLAKDVALRTTNNGKKYFQIATSSGMYECGNPSVYQVNHRQTVSGSDPPLAPLDNIDPYYLGITEEYPHLIMANQANWQPRVAGGDEQQQSSPPRHQSSFPNDTPGSDGFPPQLPKINDFGGLADRQSSPVSKARIYEPKPGYSPFCTRSRLEAGHPLSTQVEAPAPLAIPERSKIHSLKTPRNSLERQLIDGQATSPLKSNPKAPSIQSTANSVADDAQSEASVGIVSMAQSAEVVRAGYYNTSVAKFPKPGPAPTGALPSLPEGADSKTSIVYLPSNGDHAFPSPNSSPSRVKLRSPGKKNRNRPLGDAINEDAARLLRTRTVSRPKHVSQIPFAEQSPKPSTDELFENVFTRGSMLQGHEKTRESWREIRAQSRKALKSRDLNRFRNEEDDSYPSVGPNQPRIAIVESEALEAKIAKMRESASSPALLPAYQSRLTHDPGSDVIAQPATASSRPISQISPILVLAEQKPIDMPPNNRRSTDMFPTDQPRQSKRTSRRQAPAKASAHLALPTAPSKPSSDEDIGKEAPEQPSRVDSASRHSATRSTKSNCDASTHRGSYHHATAGELSNLESRLSARIAELEKKNTMLLNAFVAVINTNATFAASGHASMAMSHGSTTNGDQRSSGASGRSGLRTSGGYQTSCGELEKVVESCGVVNRHRATAEGEG